MYMYVYIYICIYPYYTIVLVGYISMRGDFGFAARCTSPASKSCRPSRTAEPRKRKRRCGTKPVLTGPGDGIPWDSWKNGEMETGQNRGKNWHLTIKCSDV